MAQKGSTKPAQRPAAQRPAGTGRDGARPASTRKGRRPRRPRVVYWRRRLLVLVVVAVVAAGVVWGVGRLFGILGDAWAAAVADQRAEAPTTDSTAQPVACPPEALQWAFTHDAAVAGQPVRFGVTVTNGSEESCLVDAGAQTLVLAITSGEDPIWSNAHCGSSDPVRLLLGPGDQTDRTVTWQGARSAVGCATVDSPVLPGTYQLTVSYATIDVPEAAAVFTLQ